MKTKILSLTIILSLIMIASGCNWIDPNINVDPTAPSSAPYSTILPTTQAGIAYVLGGDVYRFTSLFTQQHLGNARQHQSLYNYSLQESDINNAWTTMYTGPMMDLYILINKGTEEKNYLYVGISQVMMAVSLGNLTDILGDIPYSDAFKGNDQLQPKYDTQEQIYASIQKLLSDAIANFGSATPGKKPGSDDFVYGGDISKWIKAAHSLKARYFLHVRNYANASTEAALGFASNADEMLFNFATNETQSNPFYQFNSQRGDINMGPKLMELMGELKDPRLAPYTSDTVYSTAAIPNGFWNQPASPVAFMTFAELKFIAAECALNANDKPGAYQAYKDGITANMEMLGVAQKEIDDFWTQNKVNVGAGNLTIEILMKQKYIALYPQMETWVDYRRTSFPTLKPTTGTKIPVRMVYPQSERLYNGKNMPSGISIFDTKLWWMTKW